MYTALFLHLIWFYSPDYSVQTNFFKVSEYLLQLAEESLQFIYKTFDQLYQQGPVAQRITRLTTDQKIGGSNPLGIDNILI